MAAVTKPIGRVIEDVVDVVKDVGDFVQDDILIPVVDTVEDTLKAMADDPVRTIAYAAAAASGQWWALPLVAGADTAQQGGDIGDILEASAKAYVVQNISPQVGSKAGAYVGASTGSTVAASVAAGATTAATSAVILGQDPVQAALTGGVQAGVSAAMAQVRSNIAIEGEGGSIVGNDPAAVGDAGAPATVDPIPAAALSVIETQLAYTLSGQEGAISQEVMSNAILQATVSAKTVQQFMLQNTDYDPSDAQIAAITNGVIKTTSAAINGGNITQAALTSIAQSGATELIKSFDTVARKTIDEVTGGYQETEKKAGEVDFIAAEYEAAVAQYNSTREELIPRFDERARLKAEMDQAKIDFEASPTQSSSDAYNNKIKAYNAYATQLDKEYEEKYTPLLQQYTEQANTLSTNYKTAADEYLVLRDGLTSKADKLDEALVPSYDATNKAFVNSMTGGAFNEEEYVKANGLEDAGETGEAVDPYYHWLTVGKDAELAINTEQYEKKVKKDTHNNLITSLLNQSIDINNKNIDSSKVDSTDIIDGNVTLSVDEEGELFWEEHDNLADADPKWNNEAGGLVVERFNSENQKFETVNTDTNQVVAEDDRSFTFDSMEELYPEEHLKFISTFDDEAGAYINQQKGKDIYNLAKNAKTFSDAGYQNETDKSAWYRNSLVSLAKAGPEAIDSANRSLEYGHSLLKYGFGGQSGMLLAATTNEEDIGPISENVVQFTDNMLRLAENENTEAYKFNIAKFDNDYGTAETTLDKLGVIYNGVTNIPDVLLLDKIVEPALQFFTGASVLKAGKTVKEVGDSITKNLTTKGISPKKSKEFGDKFKSVAANIDNKITPSSGGATMSNNAMNNIIITGAITASMSYALKDADFEGLFSSSSEFSNVPAPVLEKIKAAPEGKLSDNLLPYYVDEFTNYQQYKFSGNTDNEGYNALTKTSELFGLNNSVYQVDDYNPKFVKRQTNDLKLNALTAFNPGLESIISNAENAPEENKDKYITQANEFLSASNVDNTKKTDIFNFIAPTQYQTSGEVQEKIQEINPAFKATPAAIASFTGNISNEQVANQITNYVDERFTDRTEVRDAYAAAGLANPTEQDILDLVGQTDDDYILEEDITKNLPAAQYNTLYQLLNEYEAENKKREETIRANTAGLGATIGDIGTQIAAQDKKFEELITGQKIETDSLKNVLTGELDAAGKKADALTSLVGAPANVNTGDVATGLYSNIANLSTNYDNRIDETQAFIDNQFKQQADATAAQKKAEEETAKINAARQAQQQQQYSNTQQLYQGLQPQAVDVKQVDPANITSPYDFKSIFRDAGQESFYQTPYRKGGQINSINDKLLKLIGDG